MKISRLISSIIYFTHVVHFACNWFCRFLCSAFVCLCTTPLRLLYYPLYTVCLQDWVHDFSSLKLDSIFPFIVNSLLLYISCNCLTTADTCFFVEKCFGKWEKKIFGDRFLFGKLQEHHLASTEINWTFSVKFIHCIWTFFFFSQYWPRLLRSYYF